jgi:hypothetical protein
MLTRYFHYSGEKSPHPSPGSPFHQLWTFPSKALDGIARPRTADNGFVSTRWLSPGQDNRQCHRRQEDRGARSPPPDTLHGASVFDGSYKPCTGTTPHGSSRRISAWERLGDPSPLCLEVCINTSLSGCPRTDASDSQPLHEWLETLEEVHSSHANRTGARCPTRRSVLPRPWLSLSGASGSAI